jgi:hypothetical protein
MHGECACTWLGAAGWSSWGTLVLCNAHPPASSCPWLATDGQLSQSPQAQPRRGVERKVKAQGTGRSHGVCFAALVLVPSALELVPTASTACTPAEIKRSARQPRYALVAQIGHLIQVRVGLGEALQVSGATPGACVPVPIAIAVHLIRIPGGMTHQRYPPGKAANLLPAGRLSNEPPVYTYQSCTQLSHKFPTPSPSVSI